MTENFKTFKKPPGKNECIFQTSTGKIGQNNQTKSKLKIEKVPINPVGNKFRYLAYLTPHLIFFFIIDTLFHIDSGLVVVKAFCN